MRTSESRIIRRCIHWICICANRCGFTQIECVIEPEVIYRDYLYVTTSSSELANHFEQYAEDVTKRLHPSGKLSVMDIGSNDGTLLKYFKNKGMNVLGIEPAKEIAEQANISGIDTIPEFFGPITPKKALIELF